MKIGKQTQEDRRQLIIDVIKEKHISTQAELSKELGELGVKATQATLSRDISELGIVKFRHGNENFYGIYNSNQRLINLNITYRSQILSAQSVMFMVICRTELGEASILADEIDGQNKAEILGTLAGADTLFIVCDSVDSANALLKEIQDALKKTV
ncbi:arginine repressor [Lactovum miscens]|uniref:Arginine repressor n=1 Tax=Lactovum miscens TaxID=190387 RepID=A0A841C9V6_9LACT|nr:arginine repressor [Lactovum miscens]MBB5887970.1 transcriptional regulator of arginine metabolism [Lactovum miscens]